MSLAAAVDLNGLQIDRPDLYTPERQALIETEWQLSQAFAHEPAQLDTAPLIHQQVKAALDWLDRGFRCGPDTINASPNCNDRSWHWRSRTSRHAPATHNVAICRYTVDSLMNSKTLATEYQNRTVD